MARKAPHNCCSICARTFSLTDASSRRRNRESRCDTPAAATLRDQRINNVLTVCENTGARRGHDGYVFEGRKVCQGVCEIRRLRLQSVTAAGERIGLGRREGGSIVAEDRLVKCHRIQAAADGEGDLVFQRVDMARRCRGQCGANVSGMVGIETEARRKPAANRKRPAPSQSW